MSKDLLKIGFTGTRYGMTAKQSAEFVKFLRVNQPKIFIHGGCVGADTQAHELVRLFFSACRIEVRPGPDSDISGLLADADLIWPRQPHLKRNKAIVAGCEILLAAPPTEEELLRSGTWATIREAARVGRPTGILLP